MIDNYEEYYLAEAKVGHLAPEFEMDAVLPVGEGLNRFGKISLEEIRESGKWTVLYFYPLDFTFVCPTEIQRFNHLYTKFKELNAEVVAVSTDSKFSHLAWQDRADLGRLDHPHASDNNMEISRAYGVLDEDLGIAWRGTFIITPEGLLKHSSVNHGEGGRNVEEVLRTLEVFQAEERGEMVPCGWNAGDKFL